MTEHCYADWDAAYVLGALSPAERREYEQHLADCARCQQALSEVTAMPGLLSLVRPDYAESLDTEDHPAGAAGRPAAVPTPMSTVLPKLRARWRRQSQARRLAFAGSVAVAAAIALAVAVVPPPWYHHSTSVNVAAGSLPEGGQWRPMHPVTPGPLSAQIGLFPDGAGTRIEIWCNYPSYPNASERDVDPYALRVRTRDGRQLIAGSWTATPNSTVMTSTRVPVPRDGIDSVQVIDNHGDATAVVYLEFRP